MTFLEWLRTRRGSLVGFQSPGYQLAIAAVDRYARLVALGPLHPEKARRYERQIERIRDALENRIWYLVPYPKYDMAWAELYQLRNELCQELPVSRVFGELLEEISDDLDYLGASEAADSRAELKEIRAGLLDAIGRNSAGNGGVNELALRVRLEALSQLAAQARDAHWLKVNMTRNRLAIMGTVILVLLVAALALLPPGFWFSRTSLRFVSTEPDLENFYWLIVLFGVLGGLISAIMDSESVDTKMSEYYIYRRLLYLRPVVGAALALIVYKAVASGLITIKGIDTNNAQDNTYLVIAFAAGFAERAFVQQLLKAAGAANSDQSSTAASKTPQAKKTDQGKQ